MIDRRRFLLQAGGAVVAAFGGWRRALAAGTAEAPTDTLRPDPHGILDLPAGFSYTVLSRAGREMAWRRSPATAAA